MIISLIVILSVVGANLLAYVLLALVLRGISRLTGKQAAQQQLAPLLGTSRR
jgi:hypothetical protein